MKPTWIQRDCVSVLMVLVTLAGCEVSHPQTSPKASENTTPQLEVSDGQTATPHFYERVRVLCIGINNYKYVGSPLNEAEADARGFGETLKHEFGYEPQYLLGSEATKAAIERTLIEFGNGLAVDEALIVFFACHGVAFDRVEQRGNIPVPRRVGYLLPYDADVMLNNPQDPRWDAEAINMHWLVDSLEAFNAHHVLLVADCCCSGFMTKRGTIDAAAHIALLRNESRTILSATTQHESAAEGIFTNHLLKILTRYSKNLEAASVTDVFDEVRGPVSGESERQMMPQMSHVGGGDGEFIFFPLSIPAADVETLKEEVEKDRATSGISALSKAGGGMLSGVIDRANKRAGRRTTLMEVSAAMCAPKYWYGQQAAEMTDYWKAMRERFNKNAAWGDPLAITALHFCYSTGLGEPEERPDPDAAYYWALTADQIGGNSGVGSCLLGRCYQLGIGIEKNSVAARDLYSQSAESGFLLGKVFEAELALGDTRMSEQAADHVQALQEGMEAGVAHSALVLAHAFANGALGLPRDMMKCVDLYESAIEMGCVAATPQLFDAYSAGLPDYPPRDLLRAEKYLRQGAEAGVAQSQFWLGTELLQIPNSGSTLKLERKPGEGLRWMELAAKQNNWRALVTLAEVYANGGDGLPAIDHSKARIYVEQGVALNASEALNLQGDWYLGDYGIYPHDPTKALRCFERSASLSNLVGCSQAGRLYESGIGIEIPEKFRVANSLHPKTHVAMHWYVQALENGGDDWAEARLNRFRDLINNEKQGLLQAPGFEPSFVLGVWKSTFPRTAEKFEQRFWQTSPFPESVEEFQTRVLNDDLSGKRTNNSTSPAQNAGDAIEEKLSLGSRLFKEGQYDRAMVTFSEAVDLNSNSAMALSIRGLDAFRQRKYDQAITLFSRALARDDGSSFATQVKELCYQQRARSHLLKGEPAAAIEDLSKALLLDDEDPWTYFNRALCYDAIGELQKAIADNSEAIRLDPDHADALSNRASTRYAMERYPAALEDYRAALELRPNHYDARYGRGLVYIELKQYDKAIADFRAAIKLRPDFGDTYRGLGSCLWRKGQLEDAIDAFDQAIGRNSRDVLSYFNRGLAQRDKKNYEQAINDLTKAIELDSHDAPAYFHRGTCWTSLRRFEQAEQDYSEAIRLKNDYAFAYTNRGNARNELGRREEAIADYSRAIQFGPEDERPYFNRGVRFFERGDHDKALQDFQRAIDRRDDFVKAYFMIGNCWFRLGDYRKAIDAFNEALVHDRQFAQAYYNRGVCWERLGQAARSRADMARATQLGFNP